MAGVELATAWINILPSTDRLAPGIKKAFGAVDRDAEAAGAKSGGAFSGALGNAVKVGGAVAAGAAVAGIGVAIAKGFGRLEAIDTATGKLRGLGHDAKSIQTIMDSALASVKGTAFGLGDAATLAATAVAAGVKPGQDLTKYLSLAGDAATIAGVSINEMGSIFGKVQTGQKAYTSELNQLADRGIPIYQWLQDELGVSADALRDMVSKGEVDSATFFKVIQKNIGGAALESGNTFRGALNNLGAAVGRLGAAFMEPVFKQLPSLFGGAIGGLDGLAGAAGGAGAVVGEAFGKIGSVVGTASNELWSGLTMDAGLRAEFAGQMDGLVLVGARLRESFEKIWTALRPLGKALQDLWATFQPLLALVAGAALGAFVLAWQALAVAIGLVVPVISAVAGWMRENSTLVQVLAVAVLAGVAAYKTYMAVVALVRGVQLGFAAASYGAAGATYAVTAAQKVGLVVGKAWAVVTNLGAVAQRALNLAMRANPIGIVVTALAALVAGLIFAYKNSETFRNIVNAAWQGVKDVVGAVVGWFTDTVIPFFTGLWDKIAGDSEKGPSVFTQAWSGVKEFFTGLWDSIVAIFIGFFTTIADLFLTYHPLGIIIANWEPIVGFFVGVWQRITAIFQGAIDWIVSTFGPAFMAVGRIIALPFELGQKIIAAIAILIMRGLQALADWAVGVFAAAWGLLQTYIVQPIVNALAAMQPLWNAISAGFTWLKDMVITAVTVLVNTATALWNVLSSAVSAIATALVNFVVAGFNGFRDTIVAIVTNLRDLVVSIWTALRDLVVGIVKVLVDTVVANFNSFRDMLVNIANVIRDSVVATFENLRAGAVDLFTRMVEGIGRVWDGLKAVAAAPVRFVIDTVINNGILKGWNDLVGLLKLPDNLKVQPLTVPGFARGGVLPGPGTSRGDDMVVMDRSGRPRATVASGEPVLSRSMYARNRGVVDTILAGGRVPAFFNGGRLPTLPGAVNPHGLPYHGARYAADMPRPQGSPVYAWNDGTVAEVMSANTSYGNRIRINHGGLGQTLYAHLSRFLVSVGQQVTQGQEIAKSGGARGVAGSGNSTGPHLHFEIRGGNAPINPNASGGDGGGLAGMALQWITDKISAPVKALIEKIPGQGMFAEAAKGMANKALDSVMEKVRSLVPTGSDGAMSGAVAGADWAANARLLMQAGKTLGADRRAMKIALMTAAQESSMGTNRTAMTRANGDGDVGWFQQRTTRGDGTIAQLADPLYALGVFLRGVRVPAGYHVPGLYNKNWQSMGLGQAAQAVQVSAFPSAYDKWANQAEAWLNQFGYWRGTNHARPGLAWVGERGPELVDFRGGERVYNNRQSRELATTERELVGAGAPVIQVYTVDERRGAALVMDELRWAARR